MLMKKLPLFCFVLISVSSTSSLAAGERDAELLPLIHAMAGEVPPPGYVPYALAQMTIIIEAPVVDHDMNLPSVFLEADIYPSPALQEAVQAVRYLAANNNLQAQEHFTNILESILQRTQAKIRAVGDQFELIGSDGAVIPFFDPTAHPLLQPAIQELLRRALVTPDPQPIDLVTLEAQAAAADEHLPLEQRFFNWALRHIHLDAHQLREPQQLVPKISELPMDNERAGAIQILLNHPLAVDESLIDDFRRIWGSLLELNNARLNYNGTFFALAFMARPNVPVHEREMPLNLLALTRERAQHYVAPRAAVMPQRELSPLGFEEGRRRGAIQLPPRSSSR